MIVVSIRLRNQALASSDHLFAGSQLSLVTAGRILPGGEWPETQL